MQLEILFNLKNYINYLLLRLVLVLYYGCNSADIDKYSTDSSENFKFVYVEIKNKSGLSINQFNIFPQMLNQKPCSLRKNSDTVIKFEANGESSYILKIIFSNGDSLKTKGNYVEDGYTLIETVYKDSIITKY